MSAEQWSTLGQVRQKLEKQWACGKLMAECIVPSDCFPLRISLRRPDSKALTQQFDAAREWVQAWKNAVAKTPFTLDWQTIKHRQLGQNQIPVALCIARLSDLTRWLGLQKAQTQLTEAARHLLEVYPALQATLLKQPAMLLQYQSVLPQLLRIIDWRLRHAQPRIYLRQLSLPGIDTKFIEQHRSVLSCWLQALLPAEEINTQASPSQFAQRFGFLDKPVCIRFRILDRRSCIQSLSDLSIPAADFARLRPDIDTVFICENDITALAFPPVERAMLIFGRGYGFDALADADWLQEKVIYYWGDIDTHGFAILHSFRSLFPHTRSFLMDRETFLRHQSSWTREPAPKKANLPYLNAEERAVYDALCCNQWGENLRLEQEYISFESLQIVTAHSITFNFASLE